MKLSKLIKKIHRCPKDADWKNTDNTSDWCNVRSEKGNICTRDKYHIGDHHSHWGDGKCIEKWKQ